MTRTATGSRFRRMPKTYRGLVRRLPPRPIHDDAEYEAAAEMAERLAGHDLNRDQKDYLEALSVFLEAYERDRWPINSSSMQPVEALRFLLQEHGMSGSDLGRLLGSRTLGPAILRGDRALSKKHIALLAEHFAVRPGIFL